MGSLRHKLIDPFIIPIGVILVTIAFIVTIGESLLGVFQGGHEKDRIDRPELWLGLGLALAIIFGVAFLATRPKGTTGFLEHDVALGKRPFFEAPLPPIEVRAKTGAQGTVKDITEGYTLYAQSGALMKVQGVLPGGSDYGKRFAGFFYGEGLYSASPELWVPFEAVMSVYPETQSAFLAIKGDETEAFGWNVPPENVKRGPSTRKEHI